VQHTTLNKVNIFSLDKEEKDHIAPKTGGGGGRHGAQLARGGARA